MASSLFTDIEKSVKETIIYNGSKFKSYRGMKSIEGMQEGSKIVILRMSKMIFHTNLSHTSYRFLQLNALIKSAK